MTKTAKLNLYRDIKRLLKRSYEDDGNSYELEFRSMLEEIVSKWDELVSAPHTRGNH